MEIKDNQIHIEFMKLALVEAAKAKQKNEIPVGAIIVFEGEVVGKGHNLRITDFDATAHAEVVAIRDAGRTLGRWNLTDCDMYVTLEPCAMCAGAIVNARIKNLFFGAADPRFGCCGTLMNIAAWESLNHRAEVRGGVLEEECSAVLKKHFADMRKRNKSEKQKSQV